MSSVRRSALQFQRVSEKFRPTEIAGFQCKQYPTILWADGSQNRHSRSDFRTDQVSRKPGAIDDGASRFTTRDDQSANAHLHQTRARYRPSPARWHVRLHRGHARIAELLRLNDSTPTPV
jgi:hypothetical protein